MQGQELGPRIIQVPGLGPALPGLSPPAIRSMTTGAMRAAAQPPAVVDLGSGSGDWPPRFARFLVEALAGRRSPGQIQPWTTERAQSQFARLARGTRCASGSRPRVVRVVATQPADDVIEMTVIAGFGTRTRALALRLERPPGEVRARRASARNLPWPDAVQAASGGWICTEIEGL